MIVGAGTLVFLATNFGRVRYLARRQYLKYCVFAGSIPVSPTMLFRKEQQGAKAQLTDIAFAAVKHPHVKAP
jgi:hypothetical protein